ncbi:hypothetical protein CIPAW_07G064300 [Carya illinoinensis]|uniref:Uncharacterized protein n=1 Tax=Carya illinoinensis TaxID=32201 RepID=A0A8T1Q0G8_CARIL|nr:hypothetical protein CIPAW_07G064300 [Carya illinoinensis]
MSERASPSWAIPLLGAEILISRAPPLHFEQGHPIFIPESLFYPDEKDELCETSRVLLIIFFHF